MPAAVVTYTVHTHPYSSRDTHASLSHIVRRVWFSCSLAPTLIQSRLVEICSPCCLIFPPLATFPGRDALPHRVAQAGLAWPQRACQVCSLSSSPSNSLPYGRVVHPALRITRAPPAPSDRLRSRELQSTSLSSSERNDASRALH